MKTRIDCNNSGGSDWLDTEMLEVLQAHGWTVHTVSLGGRYSFVSFVETTLPRWEALRQFEELTEFTTEEEGCECCGRPFSVRVIHD